MNMYTYMCICSCICMFMYVLIVGTPSPRGGFCVEWFLDQVPCVREFTTRCDGTL